MWYQVDEDSYIVGIRYEDPEPQDADIWSWFDGEIPDAFNGYKLVDGSLVYDPPPAPPIPVSPAEVLGLLIEAKQDEFLPLIPDDVVERMESWFPEWDGGSHAYEVGNIVSYGYVLYRCVQAHTSQQTWNPIDAVSLWAKVIKGDEPQPWEQPGSTNPYMKGDKVTHVGHTWVSDIDNNVWEPGVYGWTKLD